jgi:hypothetical protein
MIEEAIQKILVGINPQTFGYKLPSNIKAPAITFLKVSAPRDQTQEGPSGLVTARVQVSSWGTSYTESKLLSKQVRFALDGLRHVGEGVRIDGIELINEMDLNDPEPNIFQTLMDFRVKYAEERPND